MLVWLAHIGDVEKNNFHSRLMRESGFARIGVDLFFVISGIVISSVTDGKYGDAKRAWLFLYHRFARIYPTFWVYFLVALGIYLYNPAIIHHGGHQFVRSALLLPSGNRNLLGPAWSLTYEVYFYLVSFLCMLLVPARKMFVVLLAWSALVVGLSVVMPTSHNPWVMLLSGRFTLEFVAGCVAFRVYKSKRLVGWGGRLIGSALAALVVGGIALWRQSGHLPDWGTECPWARLLTAGTFSSLFLLGFLELEGGLHSVVAKWLGNIGDWSYSIYLSHLFIVQATGRAIARLIPDSTVAIVIVAAISLPITLLIGYFSFTYIERPLMLLLYRRSADQSNPRAH
jgi:peptidoglycan/LPS O-acetylase OafA/YrhL